MKKLLLLVLALLATPAFAEDKKEQPAREPTPYERAFPREADQPKSDWEKRIEDAYNKYITIADENAKWRAENKLPQQRDNIWGNTIEIRIEGPIYMGGPCRYGRC